MRKPHCQCSLQCAEPPLNNSPFCYTSHSGVKCKPKGSTHELSPFCTIHQKRGCALKSPLSGYEPKYEPHLYNGKATMQNSHNCFAYAFDVREKLPKDKCNEKGCAVAFHQPGRKSGYPRWHELPDKRCPDIISRIKADVPDVKLTNFTRRCPPRTSKIALVVDADQDYHFYRQDSNGMWSHKPGGTKVTNRDAAGRPIYNPQLASRDSGRLNYDTFCSFLCVPRRKTARLKRGGRRLRTQKRKQTR